MKKKPPPVPSQRKRILDFTHRHLICCFPSESWGTDRMTNKIHGESACKSKFSFIPNGFSEGVQGKLLLPSKAVSPANMEE